MDNNLVGGVSCQYLTNDANDQVRILPTDTRIMSKTTDSIGSVKLNKGVNLPANRVKRSQSMPFMIKSILSKPTAAFNRDFNKKRHLRSKSVHFDEKLPIKSYQLDDRPSVISMEPSIDTGIINFDKTIPLGKMYENDYYEVEKNGFYDFNFSVFNYEQGLTNLNVNHFFNHCKNDLYLENLNLEFIEQAQDWVLNGTICVRNIYFNKFVTVRYSTNNWRNSTDIPGKYVKSENNYDFFEFQISKLLDLINYNYDKHSINLEFCINYQTTDDINNNNHSIEFWDNNNEKNYRMKLVVGNELDLKTKEENDIKSIEKQFMNWNLSFTDSNLKKDRNKKKSIKNLLNDDIDSDYDMNSIDLNFEDKFIFNKRGNNQLNSHKGDRTYTGDRKKITDNFNSNDILQSAMDQYPFKHYNFKNSFNS